MEERLERVEDNNYGTLTQINLVLEINFYFKTKTNNLRYRSVGSWQFRQLQYYEEVNLAGQIILMAGKSNVREMIRGNYNIWMKRDILFTQYQ